MQRRSIDQPDSQVKGCFPVFLQQKASGATPLRKWEDCGEDEELRVETISALTCPFARGMGSIRSTPSA